MSFLITATASATLLCGPFYDEGRQAYGYRNCDGTVGIEATLTAADPFNACGIAAVLTDGGPRIINRKGETLLQPMLFDNGADPFREGLARYVEDRKYGYFDECGKIVIPARYDFVLPFEEGKSRGGYDCTFTPVPPFGEHSTYECRRWIELRNPLRENRP